MIVYNSLCWFIVVYGSRYGGFMMVSLWFCGFVVWLLFLLWFYCCFVAVLWFLWFIVVYCGRYGGL